MRARDVSPAHRYYPLPRRPALAELVDQGRVAVEIVLAVEAQHVLEENFDIDHRVSEACREGRGRPGAERHARRPLA
eukprot:2325709-Prymnesium_polylepis.1